VRHPGAWKHPAPGVVPHHPVRHGKPVPQKPPPPAKAHKKPAPAKKPKKPPAKKPARKWSPGYDVACCTAEAVGLLLGWGWDDVLGLYWRTASDPHSGATIEDTLAAVSLGVLETSLYAQPLDDTRCDIVTDLIRREVAVVNQNLTGEPQALNSIVALGMDARAARAAHGLILGVTLPEPHAIAVTPDGTWWSWGQPFDPNDWPGLVIEEAWCLP
jgi:hypothetical protein